MAVEFRVQDILKGQLATSILVFKWWLPTPSVYQTIGPGQFGVFFLRNTHENYEILDLYHPYVGAAPGAPKIEGSCLEKVILVLGFTLVSNEAKSRAKRDSFDALSRLEEPSAIETLKTAARVSDPDTRALATASLLERGEIDRIGPVVDFLLTHDSEVDG